MTKYKPRLTELKEDPNIAWGEVELLRWQKGGLTQKGEINYPEAFAKAADAVREGKVVPFSAAAMLDVAAEILRKKK